MASTPTANFGYSKPAVGDRGWGTTMNTNLDDIDTHIAAEHRSDSGNEGKHGPNVTIVNATSGITLDIDQDVNAAAVNIDSEATSNPLIDLSTITHNSHDYYMFIVFNLLTITDINKKLV